MRPFIKASMNIFFHSKMSFLSFSQDPTQQNALERRFFRECPLSLKILFKDKQIKNVMKIKFCKAQNLDLYLVIISCHIDRILIELGKDYGVPRGFPCIWKPGKSLQTFGFYPKFDNDDRQTPDKMEEFENVSSVRFFEKWSGFLGQTIVFAHEGVFYWTVTSKNSGSSDSKFVQDAYRIISPFMTPGVIADMYDQNLHFCCEVMSQNDQTHGARVLKESFIITAIGTGCTYYFDESHPDIVQDRFVKFFDHQEIITFCIKHNLPCGSAIIINSKENIKEFMNALSTMRDFMTLSGLQSLLDFTNCVQRIQGTVNHQEILGDVLEGLVLHLTYANGQSLVKKYKFPNYTWRTMLLRTQFHDFILSNEHLKKEAMHFVKYWCISEAGKKHWYRCALAAFMMRNNFENPTPEIGDHIVIADKLKNIPEDIDIELEFDKLCQNNIHGTIVLLLGPIGSGKTTYMRKIYETNQEKFYPIDGDLLGLDAMSTVMKLGSERNDYSIWKIIEALMMGKVPIVSTGGGVLHSFKGDFILRQKIRRALGINVQIILILPDPHQETATSISADYDPSQLYSDKKMVEQAIARRLKSNEWTRPAEFKTDQGFIDKICRLSSDNLKFAKSLLQQADIRFAVPVVNEENHSIIDLGGVDLSPICDLITIGSPIASGKFGQIRVLVHVVGEGVDKIAHITWLFDKDGKQQFSLIDCNNLYNKFPEKIVNGYVITMKSDGKPVSFAVPETPIHEDCSTHVTLDPGDHQPACMRTLALGIANNEKVISVPTKSDKTYVYKIDEMNRKPCQMRILAAFCI